MSDTSWTSFMTLLRAGLWEHDLPDCDIPVFDWPDVLQLGRDQAVMGLLLRGTAHLTKHVPETIQSELIAWETALRRVSARLGRVEADLLTEFRQAGLHPVVQKGSAVAKYYPDPELRQGGDIDLFCPEFDQARSLVPTARTAPDGAAVFSRVGVTVELHPRYYDLHLDPKRLPAPGTPCGELLLLSAHILKHAIGSGVGLKQCCDLARALEALEGKYDKEEFRAALRGAGLVRWHQLLCSVLVIDLGLKPERCLPGFVPCDPGPLRKIIRSGGNFGQTGAVRQKSLQGGAVGRKAITAAGFLRRVPFSLRYAPREAFATIRELLLGNLRRKQ